MASRYNVAATLQVNNKAFIAGFAAAERSVQKFNTALHTASASTAAYQRSMAASNAAMAASLGSVGKQSTAMKNQAEGAGRSMKTLQTAAMGAAAGATAAGAGADNAGRKMGVFGNVAGIAEQDLDRFNRTARGFAYTGIVAGVTAVTTAFQAFNTFGKYEQALAGVNKTLDLSERELREMDQAFMDMSRSIPVTYEEIAGVAEIAGQLGIEKQHIESFTDTMIRMGSSTNLSAEDASMAIARLSNILGSSQGDADRWGSTIVELGNNLATTEQEIVDMSLRIAGMGKALGMSEADVLALAGSLSSLGIRAEMGGSAISTIMSKTASEISRGTEVGENWANVMGMSVEEVATLFEEDAYGALIKMVEGLEEVDASGGNLDQTLRDLGINEIRQLDVMKRLIGASDDLAASQDMANAEWEENNALLEESAKRYETFFSQVEMAWNGVRNIFKNVGEVFVMSSGEIGNAIVEVINKIEEFTNKFVDLDGNVTETGEAFVEAAKKIGGIAVGLGIAGAAFMAFGVGGAVTVAVAAGLGAIGLAVTDLLDHFGLIPESLGGDDVESAIRLIESSTDEATAEAATNYVRLKDEALQALGDLATQSGEEAAKSREKIVEQFEQMSQEVIEAIEGDRQALNTAIAGLMEGATEPEREALEKARANIEKHYDEQLKLAQNYTETVADVMNNHITETGAITEEGMQKFNAAAQGMDQLFGTAIAKSQQEMSNFKNAFDRAFDERDVKKAQENLTGMADSTVTSIEELNKAYKAQKEAIEATDAPMKEKELILQGLASQYDESKLALLDNLAAHESEAKTLDESISAIAEMSDAQLEKLGVTREEYAQLVLTSGALRDNADENHNLSTALDAAKDAASRSSEEYGKLVEEFNKFDIGAVTVKEALGAIRDATEEEAFNIGQAFATTLADGTQEVDMGTYGTLTVEEFVAGVKSGEVTAQGAGIALTNVLRDGLGQEPLTEAGQKQVEEYVSGLQSKEVTVEEVATALGYATADGVQVNLEGEAAMNIETFVAGLKSGEFGVFEVAQIMMRNLETTMSKDFSQFGEEDMATFAAGLESGIIPTEAAIELITNSLDENMLVDLGAQGEQSVGSWIEMFTSGDIKIQEFVSGLEAFLGEGTYFDLSEPGTSTADSYTAALGAGMDVSTQVMMEYGPKLKESAKVDLSEEGGEAVGSMATGIMGRLPEVLEAANSVKNSTETTLGSTSDGGGGAKAPTDFSVGFANNMPWALSLVQQLSGNTETELGSTTDGQGGSKAGGALASGIASQIGNAQAASNSAKSTVEGALGSTTDASGGNKAGGMFVSGIRSQIGNAQSAANTHKSNTERTLGSTTDNSGGNKAGSMFVSGIRGQIGAALSAANANKSNVEGSLGATTDNGGGQKAGSMFVSGVAGQAGAARGAGNNVSSSARGGLSSNSNTYGLGQNFGSGFVRGIASYVGRAASAAASLVSSALAAIKRRQNSNSPAKETMYLGDDFGDGFALAIVDKTKEAVNAARNMARDAINAAGDESARNALAVDIGGMEYGGSAPRSVNQRIQHEITTNTADRERVVANVHIHQHGDIEWLRTEIAERDGVDATLKF